MLSDRESNLHMNEFRIKLHTQVPVFHVFSPASEEIVGHSYLKRQ